MFKRLFVVVLFAAAVSAAQPVHASTLTLHSVTCSVQNLDVACVIDVSGGTGDYEYHWRMYQYPDHINSVFQTVTNTARFGCRIDEYYVLSATVKDSSGTTTASKSAGIACDY